jgi:hypothetical protein
MVEEVKVVCKGLWYTGKKLLVTYVVLKDEVLTSEELSFKGRVSDHKNVGKVYNLLDKGDGSYSIDKQPEGVYSDSSWIDAQILISRNHIGKYNQVVKRVDFSKPFEQEMLKLKKVYNTLEYHDKKSIEEALIAFLRG